MKLHTCTIEAEDLHAAARLAHVTFDVMTEHGSRSQTRAWNVKLFGSSGRRPNGGGYGACYDGEAASWDEWGIWLSALYSVDPLMRTPYYESAEHFHFVTGRRFVTLTHAEQHRQHKWEFSHTEGLYSESVCVGTKGPSNPGCGAVQRWMTWDNGKRRTFAEVADQIPEVGYWRAEAAR